jgi:hypothetical protein
VAQQTTCKQCACGKYAPNSGATYCPICSHGTAALGSSTCAALTTASSCMDAPPPTLHLLTLPTINDVSLLTEAVARSTMEDIIVYEQKKNNALAANATKADVEAHKLLAIKESELLAAKSAPCANTDVNTVTSGAIAPGAVALDVDGNNKLDASDSIQLFVATTMQDYGASRMLTEFRAQHATNGVTPIATMLSTIKAAMDQYPQ